MERQKEIIKKIDPKKKGNVMFGMKTKRRKPPQLKSQTEADRIIARYKRIKVDPETAWPDVSKMLYKLAWRTTERYNIPFETTRSEVYYAFMKACWRWTPNRGTKFSSVCCLFASFRLSRLVMNRSEEHRVMPTVELNEELADYAPETRSPCLELVEDLSEDAKEIVSLLLDIPQDLTGRPLEPVQLLKHVKRHLVEELGRSREQVNRAHEELCARFAQEAWA